MRFREESLSFKIAETADDEETERTRKFSYPPMKKTLGSFELTIDGGEFADSEILVFLGENGTGKTT